MDYRRTNPNPGLMLCKGSLKMGWYLRLTLVRNCTHSSARNRMPPTPGGGAEWLSSPVMPSAALVPWVTVAVTKFLVTYLEMESSWSGILEDGPEKPRSPQITSLSQAWFLIFSCSGCWCWVNPTLLFWEKSWALLSQCTVDSGKSSQPMVCYFPQCHLL